MLKFFSSSQSRVRCVRLIVNVIFLIVSFYCRGTAGELTAKEFFKLTPEKRLTLLVRGEYYLGETDNYSVAFLDSLAVLANEKDDERLLAYIYLFRITVVLGEKLSIAEVIPVFEKEQDRVGECQFPDVRGLYKHYYGKYYDLAGKRDQAFQHFLAAKKEFDQIGYENLPYGGDCLNDLGLCYYKAGYNAIALRYLERAVSCPFARPSRKISVLNSVGLGYRSDEIRQYAKATKYFSLSYDLARKYKDSVYCFVNTADYARVLQLQGRNKEALAYYNRALRFDHPMENFNKAKFYLYKAEILLADNDLAGSRNCMSKSDSLIKVIDPIYQRMRLPQHYAVRSGLYRRTGEYSKVLAYNDSILMIKDSINIVASNRILEEFETAVNAEKYFSTRSKIEADKRRTIILSIVSIVGFVLIGGVSVYSFRQKRQELLKESELQQKMKLNAEQKAQRIAAMQEQYFQEIQSKNALIEKINSELSELRRRSERWSEKKEEVHGHIDALLSSTIMTDADWEAFKVLFEKIHPGFLEKINTKYSFLTSSEMRLVALSKLNIPSREMAVMLGLTKDTIYTFKYRLRKKLGSHDEDFADLTGTL
jgi:tetratricopeptide (TPR) repeat protein